MNSLRTTIPAACRAEAPDDILDSRDFYELMQTYRHSKEWGAITPAQAFEDVKAWVRALSPTARATDPLLDALSVLWPVIEKATRGFVYTAEQAGKVGAAMQTVRAALGEKAPQPSLGATNE